MIRREDFRLLTGQGCFAADVALADQAYGVFLRSDRAHARILGIDASAAREMPGVCAVMTGEDVSSANPFWVMASPHGVVAPLRAPHRPSLATERVRFVGEAVALVVAESEAIARDAIELIRVEYDDLPAVTEPLAALAAGAPQLYEDIPNNLCYAQSHGDAARTEAALKASAHVVRLTLVNNRLVPSPLEPRAVIAWFDEKDGGTYHIALGTQGMPRMQAELADLLGVARERVRIQTGDVGGAFGVKTPAYPEYIVLLAAARALRRPVKWVSTRGEAFLAEHHGRDGILEGELGLDDKGRFLAMRFLFTANMGAHLSYKSVFIAATNPGSTIAGVYRTPALYGVVRCVLTNTAVVGPYRGSGRPEMATMIERLVDEAADHLGIDRIALRRRNLINDTRWITTNVDYGSSDFAGILERALVASDWNGFEVRRAASRARARLRGIGLSCFVEATGGPNKEAASFRFTPNGVEIHCGTQSTGQGHETVFPQMVARWLGIPEERVRLVQGDHDIAVESGGTIASRSLVATGGALKAGADVVIAAARTLAARELEADVADLEFAAGMFRVVGTDRAISLLALIERLRPASGPHPLDADATFDVKSTFPNGCHVAEVEIDPDTGETAVVRYTAVDDFGEVQHRTIVEGQVHGGVAQGIGQALTEHCRYDPASGQLITGSFADYAMPRADDLPSFEVHHKAMPSSDHPFGAKGAGESGATGAPGAVMNAVAHALRSRGIAHLDMPATPAKVWQALNDAGTAETCDAQQSLDTIRI
jgi:carbon-monoxide dehydrogenase large subunit